MTDRVGTKSIYDEESMSDGTRVLVTRFYPRGIKKDRFDIWVREASPTKELLKEYRSGRIDWGEFSRRFKAQLSNRAPSSQALDELAGLAKKQKITLLCYEKEGEHCHRQILKSRLDRTL